MIRPRLAVSTLAALILAAIPAVASAEVLTDVSAQFPDAAERSQCNVGSCHIFGSIGLLEAAVFRQSGQKTRLSEMDLFVQNVVDKPGYYQSLQDAVADEMKKSPSGGDLEAIIKKVVDPGFGGEGGFPETDLKFVVDNGVATDATVSYATLLANYTRFRHNEAGAITDDDKADKDYHKKASALEGFLYDLLYRKSPAEWREDPSNRRTVVKMLLGGPDNIAKIRKEREAVKQSLQGFKVVAKSFGDGKATSSCEEDGKDARKEVFDRLYTKKAMPVVLAMNLSGLAAWGQTDSSRDARHAFIVQGIEKTDGKYVFKTRNSWGGTNPDVRADEFCRVFQVISVEAPKDGR